jgi:hypothetical protein
MRPLPPFQRPRRGNLAGDLGPCLVRIVGLTDTRDQVVSVRDQLAGERCVFLDESLVRRFGALAEPLDGSLDRSALSKEFLVFAKRRKKLGPDALTVSL